MTFHSHPPKRLTPARAVWRVAAAAVLLAGLLASQPVAARGGTTLVVGPDGPFATLQAALDAAQPGDTIEVHGGIHAGPVVVDRPSLTLVGVDWPVIDGAGQGTVVTLAAQNLVLRGFVVRGSGKEPDRDHSGITLTASGIVVEHNRLEDVLFGVFVAQADGAIVRGNDISSKPELEVGRRGDAVRVWYSQGALVESNTIHDARDLVAWYSAGLVLRGNVVERGRYGIHLMYCDDALIEANRFQDNSVGVFTMYSQNVTLRDNLIRGHRGPSGYGLGFKDAGNVTATGNVLVDNRAGIFLDGTPFSPEAMSRFERNVLAFNDTGVILLPAVKRNVFAANTFWENVEQVTIQGGGQAGANEWAGNFWSDYAGYDADGDGLGDTPYRAERLFDSLLDREPTLRILLYSPTVQALEAAAAAFPVVRPLPKLVDPAPQMAPASLPAWSPHERQTTAGLGWAAAGLLALSGLCGLAARGPGERAMRNTQRKYGGHSAWAAFLRRRGMVRGERPQTTDDGPFAAGLSSGPLHTEPDVQAQPDREPCSATAATLVVNGVSKRYGRALALSGISFEARPGEAIALWGANGAGKSTLLKAMLGLVAYQGTIAIAGHDAAQAGKLARRHLGYVPQEAAFYDLSVTATLQFYAQLKRAGADRIPPLLERLGLAAHAHKSVNALSGGLKQRLALGIALLSDPPVLLLDEPTANLDAQAQQAYLALLADLRTRERKTIVFASHRLEEVEAVADRVLLLEHGQLVATLTPAELLVRLLPQVELTLWVPAAQRHDALSVLTGQGWAAHFNGRGTVVVQVRPEHKLQPFQALQAQGISIEDFELGRGCSWN